MAQRGVHLERWTPGRARGDLLDAAREIRVRAYDGMLVPLNPEEAEAARVRQRTAWISGDGGAKYATQHVALDDGVPIATATTFLRTIIPEAGAMDILALSGVAVEPERQGEGLGTRVVRDAFDRLKELGLPAMLFQTGLARRFYEKLGARCIDNWFFDGRSEVKKANPWKDRYVMIYPADAAWPQGPIDLGGPAY